MRARTDSQRIADLEEMVCVLCEQVREQRRELSAQIQALELMVKRRARKARPPQPTFPARRPQPKPLARAS